MGRWMVDGITFSLVAIAIVWAVEERRPITTQVAGANTPSCIESEDPTLASFVATQPLCYLLFLSLDCGACKATWRQLESNGVTRTAPLVLVLSAPSGEAPVHATRYDTDGHLRDCLHVFDYPTLITFRDGRPAERSVGVNPIVSSLTNLAKTGSPETNRR